MVIDANLRLSSGGSRLQITADVDLDGLKKLQDMLDKYEEKPEFKALFPQLRTPFQYRRRSAASSIHMRISDSYSPDELDCYAGGLLSAGSHEAQ